MASLLALAVATYLLSWFASRSDAVQKTLAQGIDYVRVIGKSPRSFAAHLVLVNLRSTNLQFFVTPADPATRPTLKAATAGEFLEKYNLQFAINANFFDPFHSKSPWDYYPKRGDPVTALGIAASQGDIYSTQIWAGATLYISKSNQVRVVGDGQGVWNAISGDQRLLQNGRVVAIEDNFGAYPRAAAGLNETGDKLILAIVDGKQPGYSEGLTAPEFAEWLHAQGAHNAINLDGGGSVTMVVADANGKAKALNSPIHTRIPGRQRPVANHLGIRAGTVR